MIDENIAKDIVEGKNIVKTIPNEKEPNNPLFYFDADLLEEKIKEYKKVVDDGTYKIQDTLMNMMLVSRKLMEEKEDKYKQFGEYIQKRLYGGNN